MARRYLAKEMRSEKARQLSARSTPNRAGFRFVASRQRAPVWTHARADIEAISQADGTPLPCGETSLPIPSVLRSPNGHRPQSGSQLPITHMTTWTGMISDCRFAAPLFRGPGGDLRRRARAFTRDIGELWGDELYRQPSAREKSA